MNWDVLNARARGLGTHLLGRHAVELLAQARDLPSLAEALGRAGYPIEAPATASAIELELASRRVLGARLRALIRWAGPHTQALAVIFEDEGRRSLAALFRGAAQHAPPESRLTGLIPTPELPERALEELAAQPAVGAVSALLTAWKHPLAGALSAPATSPEPDMLRIDTALNRGFAARALAMARRAGRRDLLLRHVRQLIDITNASTALILAHESDTKLADHWVSGGGHLTQVTAEVAVAEGSVAAAGKQLATGFPTPRLARVFAAPAAHPAGLEPALLAAQIADLRDIARRAPLSAAPLLGYALRLRAEALDIRRLVWGVSLGAPAGMLLKGLVTA